MDLFRRAIRIFLLVTALIGGLAAVAAAVLARLMLVPARQPLWGDPGEFGMRFESITFPARDDGVRLSGWFVPAKSSEGEALPAVILVHSWMWQRLGDRSTGVLAGLLRTTPVDLRRLAFACHQAGYHVLMYDSRNHGESASAGGVTFGYQEANDVLGAVDYLQGRDDVAAHRIGVVGFSMGANAALYALARTSAVRALVAVQPVMPLSFLSGLAEDMLGQLGRLVVPAAVLFARVLGGMPPGAVNPVFAAGSAGQVPVLFIQGAGDRWGRIRDVDAIAKRTPQRVDTILVADAHHRYDGFQYVLDHPEISLSFFEDYLSVD